MALLQVPYYTPQAAQPQVLHHTSKKKYIIAAIVVTAVSLISILLLSSFIFGSPAKPDITSDTVDQLRNDQTNPTIKNESLVTIKSDSINYLANELGAYKLHDNPLNGQKPEIEVDISDTGQNFTANVEKNIPQTLEQNSQKPDIKIITDSKTLVKVLASHSLNADVLNYYKQGKIVVVVMNGFDVLFFKGYRDIYSSLGAGGVSGSAINVFGGLLYPNSGPKGFFL